MTTFPIRIKVLMPDDPEAVEIMVVEKLGEAPMQGDILVGKDGNRYRVKQRELTLSSGFLFGGRVTTCVLRLELVE